MLIADSQRMFADAVAETLATRWGFEVGPEKPAGGPEAIDAAVGFHPDVAVIDYWLVGMEGPAVTRMILHRIPSCKVIVLSWFYSPSHVREALSAGAVGFLPKSLLVSQLADAVRRAHAGEAPVFAPELEGLVKSVEGRGREVGDSLRRMIMLTPQEIRILILLSLGLSTEEVAKRLFIGVGTLRNHIQGILKKTGARSRVEAIGLAQQHGLLQGTPPTPLGS